MKTKIIIAAFVFILSACATPAYFSLPQPTQVDISPRGSYLYINRVKGPSIAGELITIENNNIILLVDKPEKKCVSVPIGDVKKFVLRYAQNRNYHWSILTHSLLSLTHGYFLIITFPVNFITTAIISSNGQNAHSYKKKDLTFEQMKMFTRFPQGIPPGVDIAGIQ